MDLKAAQRELKSCEQHLADIREIMISNEAKLNQLKAKRIQTEKKLPRLSEKVALGQIPSEQLEQAKEELKNLKRKLFEIPILLKGLNSEESQYIERISKAKRTIISTGAKGDVKRSRKSGKK